MLYQNMFEYISGALDQRCVHLIVAQCRDRISYGTTPLFELTLTYGQFGQ